MKENYKKEYEDLIEKLRKARKDVNKKDSQFSQIIDDIVPNLIDNEDERIGKEIIRIVDIWTNSCPVVNGIPVEKLLSWLKKQIEHANFRNKIQIGDKVTRNKDGVLVNLSQLKRMAKQGEQKPIKKHNVREFCEDRYGCVSPCPMKLIEEEKYTDNVEPKFMFGNWYLCIKNFYGKGVRFDKGKAYYCGLDGCLQQFDSGAHICIDKNLYEYFRIWTIRDAKDGDVLACENDIVIFKENNYNPKDKSGCMFIYCSCNNFYETGGINPTTYKPATEEQCDLLFKKMHEAGYEWDSEKKELKKIEQNSADCSEDELSCFESALFTAFSYAWQSYLLGGIDIRQWTKEQSKELLEAAKEELKWHNSAWSKEDERMLDIILNDVNYAQKNFSDSKLIPYKRKVDWFNSIKERIQPQPQNKSLATSDLDNSLCDIQDRFSDTSYEYRILGEAIEFIRCTESKPNWKPSEISPNGVYPEADGVRIWHDGHTFKIPKNWNKGLWPLLNDVGRRKASMDSSYFCELDTQFDWDFIEATKKIQELGTDIPLNDGEFLITMPIFHAIYLNRWELNVALYNMGAEEIKLGENIWIAQRRSKSEAFGYNKYNNLTRFSVGSINRCIIIMP